MKIKIKRCIASVLAGVCCMNLISSSASAHDGDVFAGSYIGKTKAEFVLRINSSARNEVLTFSDVYQYGTEWNGISSNVDLKVVNAGGGMPTIANQLNVDGAYLMDTSTGFVAGRTIPYDENGIRCDYSGGENLNWLFSKIEMSISAGPMAYYRYLEANREYAKKSFVHEVGHCLKLKHPDYVGTHPGHNYNGADGGKYPLAIMNQGPSTSAYYVSSTITDHDKSCLTAKWGN